VGLIQRVLDIIGIPTISLSLVKEITALIKPSKALFIQHPFGLTLGDVDDGATHEAVLRDCLHYAMEPLPPGTIVDLPYQWKDDLRERQLRKALLK
jgi:D-proline reductase (dithiol) PrdB